MFRRHSRKTFNFVVMMARSRTEIRNTNILFGDPCHEHIFKDMEISMQLEGLGIIVL